MFFRVPSALSIVLCFFAGFSTVQGGQCGLKAGGTVLVCTGIEDHPNSLDANIQAAFPLSSPPESRTKVTSIQVITSRGGSVTINEHTLLCFPNLIELIIRGDFKALDGVLNIHPRAFRHTPALRTLRISWISVSDGTIQAIASLKDQLETLKLAEVRSKEKLVPHLACFSRLRDLDLGCEPTDGELVPSDLIIKSAPILERFVIIECPPPDSKITARMFAHMPNLVTLEWLLSNVTEIEAGSFDANPKLENLNFNNNRIRSLPDGLFARLKKLESVDLRENVGLDGLTRSNFSHVEKYCDRFWFYMGKWFE